MQNTLTLEHIVSRLIESGYGDESVPAIEGALSALALDAADQDGSMELDELLKALNERGAGVVAERITKTAQELVRESLNSPSIRRAEVKAAGMTVRMESVPSAAAPRADGSLRHRSLTELHFQIAHSFEGSESVRRIHYSPIAALVRPGQTVVDIGCGDGLFLELVRERGGRGVGLELDPDKVAVCMEKGLEVHQCRAQDFDWAQGPIDFVSLLHIVEHIPPTEVLEIFDRAYRSLSEDGRMFVLTPNFMNPYVANMNFWLDVTHVRPYPELLLNKTLSVLGFPGVQSGTMGNDMDTWCYGFANPVDRLAA